MSASKKPFQASVDRRIETVDSLLSLAAAFRFAALFPLVD